MAREDYDQLNLKVGQGRLEYTMGGMPYPEYDLNDLEEVELLTAKVFSSLASQRSVEWWTEAIECIGKGLFRVIVPQGYREGVSKALEKARRGGLRIRLEFTDDGDGGAALAFLPWEFLYTEDPEARNAGIFLATDDRFALYRRLTTDSRPPKKYRGAGVRLLLVVADVEEGEELIRPILELLQVMEPAPDAGDGGEGEQATGPTTRYVEDLRDLVDIPEPGVLEYYVAVNPGRARLQELIAADGADWNIIHFVGHSDFLARPGEEGGGGHVGLVENGALEPYSEKEFARFLAIPEVGKSSKAVKNDYTDLVILQSCEGGTGAADLWTGFRGVAPAAVRKGFPVVVAMQFEVETMVGNKFATTFYSSLFEGAEVHDAVQAGRRALAQSKAEGTEYANRDFASPVLFSDGEDLVFFPTVKPLETEDRADEGGRGADRQEQSHGQRAQAAPETSTQRKVAGTQQPANTGQGTRSSDVMPDPSGASEPGGRPTTPRDVEREAKRGNDS